MKKTKLGATLYNCIRSGVYNLDTGVGVYALDAESYKVFSDLFEPIIEDYHGFYPIRSTRERKTLRAEYFPSQTRLVLVFRNTRR
ncbi:unnamed protein product, partial [Mesorhabditis belari]|uniref:Phosphagen kinase N-terminal domain-containing protein n=1 Tax=Mesorhabditis belari TaxID=2138241 RepID=A0AAF3J988_9BILA